MLFTHWLTLTVFKRPLLPRLLSHTQAFMFILPKQVFVHVCYQNSLLALGSHSAMTVSTCFNVFSCARTPLTGGSPSSLRWHHAGRRRPTVCGGNRLRTPEAVRHPARSVRTWTGDSPHEDPDVFLPNYCINSPRFQCLTWLVRHFFFPALIGLIKGNII